MQVEVTRVAAPACPDFELDEPRSLDRKVLMPVEGEPLSVRKTKELTLLLGLAFNDLKLLSWTQQQLFRGRPPDAEFSAYAGQWRGMTESLNRLAAGAVWEVGKLLQHYQAVVASPIVRAAIKRTRRENRKAASAWASIVDFANAHRTHKDARQYYDFARNRLAYHYEYGGADLIDGYRRHFTTRPEQPASEHAYVSLGKNMEMTRFFFSDAAAQGAIRARIKSLRLPGDTMIGYVRLVNLALRYVVDALLAELEQIAERRL